MKMQALRDLALVTALLTLASCGDRNGGSGDDGGTPQAGGVAVIAEGSDINLPIAVLANTLIDGDLASDVMNVQLVRGGWENGELVYRTADKTPMAAARSYEVVGADSSALRFHMRSDLKWSDGQRLTARDFRFTYDLVRDTTLASPRLDFVENLDSVSIQDDSTLTFHYKRRYAQMVEHASLPPTPFHVFGATPPAQLRTHPALLDPSHGKLVTSGPWMIGEWQKGQRVVLTHNPNFQPQPRLAQLVFRIIPEPTTRIVEIRTGTVDMLRSVTTSQIPTLKPDPAIRLEHEQKRAFDFIAYNPKGFAPFADPDVRRALTVAIDYDRLIQGLQLQDFAAPAGGPYPPIFRISDPKLMPPPKYDPARAKQLLAARGWKDVNGDGILEKDGKPLRFTMLTNPSNQRRVDAAQIIQQAWRQVGVDAQVRGMEFNTLNKAMEAHDFEAVLGGFNAGLGPDFISNLYGTGSPINYTAYSNPEVDALFEQARQQPTPAAASAVWQKAAIRVIQDQPVTWLYFLDTVDPVRQRLKGQKIDTYGAYQNTWEWWIPKSQQRGQGTVKGDSAR